MKPNGPGALRRASAATLLTLAAACGGGDAASDAGAVETVERDLVGAGAPAHAELAGDASVDDAGRLSLPAGARAAVAVELPEGGRLRVAGAAAGEGALELSFVFADPVTLRDAPLAGRTFEPDGDGRIAVAAPLPAHDGPLVLALRWDGAPGSSAVLERVTLEEPAPPRRPPVVFVSIDTLTARHVSVYGYERETTPNLERFAREAVVFEHCVANATWTTPSYASQLTGLYPGAFAIEPESLDDRKLAWWVPAERWTLAERMAALGYRTAAFIDNPLAGERFGFAQGFEVFDTSAAKRSITDPDGGIRHILPLAEAWLDRHRAEPFFLLLQVLDCHTPYVPHERVAGRFAEDGPPEARGVPVVKGRQTYGALSHRLIHDLLGGVEPPAVFPPDPVVAAYDEEILDIDLALGELFESLERRGLLDEAVVIVSADHGESMVGHDWFFHHRLFYEEILHVPLLVRLPGGEGGGRRVEQTVQLVDLMPTLAELTGFALPPEATHGRSLVPLLTGAEEALASKPILSYPDHHWGSAILHDGWKLIASAPAEGGSDTLLVNHPRVRPWLEERCGDEIEGLRPDELVRYVKRRPELERALRREFAEPRYELYHLPDDPDETENLAAREPERVERLKALMERETARVEAARARHGTAHEPLAPSPELLEEMAALGYADDE